MNNNCLIISYLLFVCATPFNALCQDSLHETDSFILEANSEKHLYFDYKVSKKQTLYNISRTFDISLDSLINFNHLPEKFNIRENASLKIPIYKAQLKYEHNNERNNTIGLYYKIKKGETLYHLCKRKFDLHYPSVVKLNKSKQKKLNEGSIILLAYIENKELLKPEEREVEAAAEADMEIKKTNIFPDNEVTEIANFTNQSRGIAICEKDYLGTNRLFALHKTAKMESHIEIENPILRRKVYAKVIGRIPPIYEADVQVVLSSEAARQLGAIDKRFFVSLRYR